MRRDNIDRLEFYYDSETENPREDPDELREQLSDLANTEGIQYEETDIAKMPSDKRQELYHEKVTGRMRERLPYVVGSRTFSTNGGTFGSMRPALLVYYDGEEVLPDVYPHRDPANSHFVTVQNYIDGDITEKEPTSAQEPDEQPDEESSQKQDSTETTGIVHRLKRILAITIS